MARLVDVEGDGPRLLLAGIRMLNGALALLAPGFLIGRLESTVPPSPAATYAFRMFGIRTLLIGRDLLSSDDAARSTAIAEAPLIHACDTATATLLTLSHRVRTRNGVPLIAISGLNTVLALLVRSRHRRRTTP